MSKQEAAWLAAGDQLSPQRLALLAGQGLAEVEVLRKVRIGLISTGSELRDPGEPLGRGQIYNSNRIMIRAMLSAFPWAEIDDYGIVPDRLDALAEAFGEAAHTLRHSCHDRRRLRGRRGPRRVGAWTAMAAHSTCSRWRCGRESL